MPRSKVTSTSTESWSGSTHAPQSQTSRNYSTSAQETLTTRYGHFEAHLVIYGILSIPGCVLLRRSIKTSYNVAQGVKIYKVVSNVGEQVKLTAPQMLAAAGKIIHQLTSGVFKHTVDLDDVGLEGSSMTIGFSLLVAMSFLCWIVCLGVFSFHAARDVCAEPTAK